MTEELLKQKIEECLELIKYSSKSISEAPDRATKFLIMQAFLVDEKHKTEQDKIKLITLSEACFAQAVSRAQGGVTEKKVAASVDPDYAASREALERCEAKIAWIKAYIDIMNNAHLTHRQFMRE
jgi:hypothetical protein